MNLKSPGISAARTLMFIALIAAVIACSGSQEPRQVDDTVIVEQGTIVATIIASGMVVRSPNVPEQQLTFGVTGTVGDILVHEGEQVDLGQELAILDPTTIRALEQRVIQSRVNLREANEALKGREPAREIPELGDILTGASLVELRTLETLVRNTQVNLDNAIRDSKLTEIKWSNRIQNSQDDYDNAFDAYNRVLKSWLGIALSQDETVTNPASLLERWNIILAILFDPNNRRYKLAQFGSESAVPVDNPDTRWDEGVVYAWQNLYPGAILIECPNAPPHIGELCIMGEMEASWDILNPIKEKLETETLVANKERTSVQNIVTNLRQNLSDNTRKLSEFRDGVILDMDLRGAKLELAQRNLDDSLKDLRNSILYAPFQGVIVHIYTNPDDSIGEDDVILRLIDPTALEMVAIIDHENIGEVKIDQESKIVLDSDPESSFSGSIVRIVPEPSQTSTSFRSKVILSLAAPQETTLREGLTGQITIPVSTVEDALLVPHSSVKIAGNDTDPWVNLYVGGTIERRSVKLGIRDRFSFQIVDGLVKGDSILRTVEEQE